MTFNFGDPLEAILIAFRLCFPKPDPRGGTGVRKTCGTDDDGVGPQQRINGLFGGRSVDNQ